MKKSIYFDYAATTPVDPRVLKAMRPYYTKKFGNTMSVHDKGSEGSEGVERVRKIIAAFVNAEPEEIIFTSSATESNNLALKGIAWEHKNKGNHIIISSIEHDCVLNSANWLETQGFEVTRVGVDEFGLLKLDELEKAIRPTTILVSVIHGNNEIGTVQNIREIGRICRNRETLFHTDAAQSFGKIPINVKRDNIDLLTASSHKIYGPKGVAILYKKKNVMITPLLHGGGHENGLRSSTVNVAGIVGFGKAVEICLLDLRGFNSEDSMTVRQYDGNQYDSETANSETITEKKSLDPRSLILNNNKVVEDDSTVGIRGYPLEIRGNPGDEITRIAKFRDMLIHGILTTTPNTKLNGHPTQRLANNANISFAHVEGESLLLLLNAKKIYVSTGSACSSSSLEPSHVIMALGKTAEEAHGSIRFSLGRWTTEGEIKRVLEVLPGIVHKLRRMSPFGKM